MAKTEDLKKEKPYSKPNLIVYGRMSELTASLGINQAKDGGTGSMQKTAI